MPEPDRREPYLGRAARRFQAHPTERRLHARIPLDRHSQLSWKEGVYDCRILEISGSGAAILCNAPAYVGDKVTLQLPETGPIPAVIARKLIEGFALSFDLPESDMSNLGLRLRILADLRRFA